MSIDVEIGSAAERIAIFFQSNLDEVLDRSAAAAKLGILPTVVDAVLMPAVDAGLITIGRDVDMGRVWRAGPRLKHWRAAGAASLVSAPARARASARGVSRLAPLPIAGLTIAAGLPAPSGVWSRKGQTKYDHIFETLTADGVSVTDIPRKYLGALKKAVHVYVQQRPALARISTLSVHLIDKDSCGIWRRAGAMPPLKPRKMRVAA